VERETHKVQSTNGGKFLKMYRAGFDESQLDATSQPRFTVYLCTHSDSGHSDFVHQYEPVDLLLPFLIICIQKDLLDYHSSD
jgi:hypothetical protein